MKTRKLNDEVLYPDETPVLVDWEFVEWLKREAERNPRRRIRLCAHDDPNAIVHEMLIVHAGGTYIRPHKHLTRRESFQILEGTADLVLFDENGNVDRVIAMGPPASGRPFYHRSAQPAYHTLLIHTPQLVFLEVTQGPFNRADTAFPSWAPEDGNQAAVQRYLEQLKGDVQRWREQHGCAP